MIRTLSCALFAMISLPAFAANSKTYPGLACQPETTSYSKALVYGSGAIYNSSSASVYVDCPVIDDGGDSNDSVEVYFYNQTSTSISCYFYARELYDGSVHDSDSASAGTGYTNLSLSSVDVNHGEHYEFIRCKLPAATSSGYAYLLGYTHEET